MKEKKLKTKIVLAAKWSTFTSLAAKIVSPITNIILARILMPEEFGVIVTVTMIISFADMLTDSGFQKYLIQQQFKNEDKKFKSANVAFWTNFMLSIIILSIIFLFKDPIATMVGNPGLGNVIAIASVQILLTSFSSIQVALYKRDFDFKTLFLVRMASVFIPFIVTIPLAFLGMSYWSLIIGTLVIQLVNVIVLTIKSKWRPKLYYSFSLFKEMFSFSMWSLIESISIWLTLWIDVLLISSILSSHELGLYKTSINLVNSLFALITASAVPVLFSALSRLQANKEEFNKMYFQVQKLVSIFILPLGIGLFIFNDLATQLMLGEKWKGAAGIIGIWALVNSIKIVFCNFASEVYRAKGKPKLSFLAQILHLAFLIPTILISSKYGFWALIYAVSLIKLQFVLVNLLLLKYKMGFSILTTFKNLISPIIASVIMGIIGYYLASLGIGYLWDVVVILFSSLIYLSMLMFFSDTRKKVILVINKVFSLNVTNNFKSLFQKN